MTDPNTKKGPEQPLDIPAFQTSIQTLGDGLLAQGDQRVHTDMLELCVDAFEQAKSPDEVRDVAIAIQMTTLPISLKNNLMKIAARAVFEKPDDAIHAIDITRFQVREDVANGLRKPGVSAQDRAKLIALETRGFIETKKGFNPRAILG